MNDWGPMMHAHLSVGALRWALSFYGRHLVLVLGLSLVASLQRFVTVSGLVPGGPLAAGAGEGLTAAARVVLVIAALVLMLRELHPPVRSLRAGWHRFEAGLEGQVGAFLLQFVFLALAFAFFDLVPTWAVSSLAAEEHQDLVTAIVLAVKNPTVIALTFLWLIGLARHFVIRGVVSR